MTKATKHTTDAGCRQYNLPGINARREAAATAELGLTTVVHPQQGEPYNVALIDVDEGFRMMSRVEDIAPTQVRIGMRVKFRTHQAEGDEPPYPVFTPVEGA